MSDAETAAGRQPATDPVSLASPEIIAGVGGAGSPIGASEASLDAVLVQAWQAGDRSAFERLYERHAERVWRYARYFSGNDEAAGEIVQETFLRVLKYLKSFEGRAKFSTWLFTVVRSVAVSAATRMTREMALTDGSVSTEVVSGALEPPEILAATERRDAVRVAIARLPAPEREALLLYEIEGLSMQDAAEVLGWTTAKVKITVFRARRRLRDFLLPRESG